MNRYTPSTPRAAFGLLAAALTIVTFCLAVVVPATMESGGGVARTLVAVKSVASAATQVAVIPARIDVAGVREPESVAHLPAMAESAYIGGR